MLESLLEKIKKRSASICVIGLGRVGLPLATVFASCGLKVFGIEADIKRLELIKNSKCPFYDPKLQDILEKELRSQNLFVYDNLNSVNESVDIIFVTVGTPTVENNVDYAQIFSVLDEIKQMDITGKMIIFRSTMPPKTTTDIIIPFLEHHSSLKCGIDFGIAMCPERTLEGKAIQEIYELPEIVGGINEISNKIASEIFLVINPKKEIWYTSPTGAELAKLFANSYRYTNFALANEFAIWAEKYGLDASELIKIVNHHYPRSNIPIPGFAGGPCLSKDGLFLDNDPTFSSIISSVWKLNESIPQHIVNNIKKVAGKLFNKKIAILGISFKAGSDDLRNSPSAKLAEILKSTGADVLIHDPYVKDTLMLSEVLDSSDIVIIATNHKEFSDYIEDIRKSKAEIIYDVWGMFKEDDFPNKIYLKFGKAI